MRRIARYLPLLALLGAIAAAWALGLPQRLSWQSLRSHEAALRTIVAAHPLLTPIAYTLFYVIVTALSIPEAALLSIAGGFLFGAVLGGICIEAGATGGAAVVFLAARSALGEPLRRRAGPLIERIRPGLERDAFRYLLFIRLLPIVPFWLANLAPALLGMRLLPFVLATALGIIPGVAFFASLGAGLGDVLATNGEPGWSMFLSTGFLLPRFGLALVVIAPVLWRKWRGGRHG